MKRIAILWEMRDLIWAIIVAILVMCFVTALKAQDASWPRHGESWCATQARLHHITEGDRPLWLCRCEFGQHRREDAATTWRCNPHG